MEKLAHHIQKQSIEIHFAGIEDAMGLQNEIADVFYTKLQPKMEALFGELCGDNYLVSLEKLEIDCGILSGTAWEEEWVETTLRKLKAELITAHRKPLSAANDEAAEACFLFYLEQGHFPWNSTAHSLRELEELLRLSPVFVQKLKTLFAEKANTARRLANSFSTPFRKKLINAFVQGHNEEWQQVQSAIGNLDIGETIVDEATVIAFSSKEQPIAAFLSHLYNRVDAKAKTMIERFAEDKINMSHIQAKNDSKADTRSTQRTIDELYIDNAGLILLHPFLPQFFATIGFTEKGEWRDETSQHTAVRALQYLACGEDEYEESIYPLNKILCGLYPADVVTDCGPLAVETKEAGEFMLSNLIGHWKQLKNTGTEAFRQTFLQRAGKLMRVDEGWLLQVEAKSVDVLLSFLPWGIGVVKLPWMKEMLYVEWG